MRPRTKYSPEVKAEALGLLAEVGKAEAARRTGIPAGTIAAWGSREGVHAPADVSTTARGAAETKIATVAERKARLAEQLLDDIDRLRRDMFAPTLERKPVAVSDGHLRGAHVEIVDVHHATTTPGERKLTMTAIAIAVDKIQILTGEATERIETLTGRSIEADAIVVVDELAARRAS